MLENSVWKQYHNEKTIHQVLVALYQCDNDEIRNEENMLYASLKRRLTKKELRGFIMKEAANDEALICEQLGLSTEDLEKLLRKAYRKIRQNDMRNEVTVSSEE
ncbi:MAG: hypothetical protein U9R50_09895 [Campylobacterota bacterium]|nr:hypothetical protein [Campylobacterota bacterium]